MQIAVFLRVNARLFFNSVAIFQINKLKPDSANNYDKGGSALGWAVRPSVGSPISPQFQGNCFVLVFYFESF